MYLEIRNSKTLRGSRMATRGCSQQYCSVISEGLDIPAKRMSDCLRALALSDK